MGITIMKLLLLLLATALALPAQSTGPRVPIAKTATLTVTSDGTPPFIYQWFKNDAPLTSATGAQLVIANFADTHAGIYHCVVSNEAGSTTSNKISLVPVKAPSKSTITVSIAVGTVNP